MSPLEDKKLSIYVSYSWKDREQGIEGSREEIVDKLCEAFEAEGHRIIRDKKDMQYRDLIRGFMNDIAGASVLIAVISEKYLKSPYCMYELASAWDKGNFQNRIFPIILPDANKLYDDSEQINLVNHWEQEYKKYKEAIANMDDAAKEGFLQKLRDREFIYQCVSGAITNITSMVCIEPEKLISSNFADIIKQVEDKILGGNSN